MKVYKYPIPTIDCFSLLLPRGAKVLCVQPQGDAVCIWALVDPDAEKLSRKFYIVGTGHELGSEVSTRDAAEAYVGTFQVHGGTLVFHLFEAP